MLPINNSNNNSSAPKKKKWFGFAALFLLALVSLLILSATFLAFGLEFTYAEKFYPGISLDSYSVGGKTKEDVKKHFQEVQTQFDSSGIDISGNGKKINIKPLVIGQGENELAQSIVSFDWDKTIDQAYRLGRSGNKFENFIEQIKIFLSKPKFEIDAIFSDDVLLEILKSEFKDLEEPTTNAGIEIKGTEVLITEEKAGQSFDYKKAVNEFKEKALKFDFSPIALELVSSEPTITKEQAQIAANEILSILDLAPIKLKYEKKEWTLGRDQFKDFIEFQYFEDKIVVGLNQEKTTEFLKTIAKEIDIEPKDARFEVKDGKVAEFQQSIDGKKLNLEITYAKINQRVIDKNNSPIDLEVELTKSATSIGSTNDLGISELIGRGQSNFKGSPTNRRINIANGARILNGILIAPGEEFSTIKSLGAIDGEHGFKQELVIKGNRTIPEYGGGLCQIGTTVFRAALRSGLPITQRRNHSYRVTYYEPAGMDATIYDPQPDLKFLNDTGKHILVTARIEGDELIFDFYGTKDGRKIEISPDPPKIYNIKGAGEPRYIETTDLKPGEKKKVETAHAGADTYFKYTVTYPNGEVKDTEFTSHYVPWPEVWLIGAQAATSTEATDQAGAGTVAPEVQ